MALAIISGEHYIGARINVQLYDNFGSPLPIESDIQWYGNNTLPFELTELTELIQYRNCATIQILNPIPTYLIAKVGTAITEPFMIIRSMVAMQKQEQLPVVGNGLNLSNPISNLSGLSTSATNINRINQSLRLILSTAKGEYPMIPNFGTSLYKYQFKTIFNETDLESIRQSLYEEIQDQEPRIQVLKIEVQFDYVDTIYISIEYCLKNTNISGSLLYNKRVGGEVNV